MTQTSQTRIDSKFIIFEDKKSEWRWRFNISTEITNEDTIACSCDSFKSVELCKKQIKLVKTFAPIAETFYDLPTNEGQYFLVFKDEANPPAWRWHLVSSNQTLIEKEITACSCDSMLSPSACEKYAELLSKLASDAPIVIE